MERSGEVTVRRRKTRRSSRDVGVNGDSTVLANSIKFCIFVCACVGLLSLNAVTIDELRSLSGSGPLDMSPRFGSVTLTNFAREKVGKNLALFPRSRRPIGAWFKLYFNTEKILLKMEQTRLPAAVQERGLYQWTGCERLAEIEPKNGIRTFFY